MSRRDDRVSLVDMLIYAKEAVALSSGTSLDDVVEDRVMQLALQKLVEIVGEAANRVSEETQQKHTAIPWPQIIGLRNRWFTVTMTLISTFCGKLFRTTCHRSSTN